MLAPEMADPPGSLPDVWGDVTKSEWYISLERPGTLIGPLP
jgi:hypothetical protein